MSTTAPRATLEEYLAELTQQHKTATHAAVRSPTGQQIRRRLESRLADLGARANQLSEKAGTELVGLSWLNENHHIIHEATEQIGSSLPSGYVRQLPAIGPPHLPQQVRIKALAEAIVERGTLPLDVAWVEGFLQTYQQEIPLTLGELWALPAYLRIHVIESLCEALSATCETSAAVMPGESATSSNELVATLSGAILSLRVLAATPWQEVVERLSVVESILTNDPCGAYSQMDAKSRNQYRERVERLARRLHVPQPSVATAAVRLAQSRRNNCSLPERHVGYYLLDDGVPELVTEVAARLSVRERLRRWLQSKRSWIYAASIGLPTVLSLPLIYALLTRLGLGAWWTFALLIAALVPAVTIWTEVANWLITQFVPPRVLPKLDFSEAIPEKHATLVATPCMLGTADEIDRLLSSMEINYLGNDDPALRYVLLSDFVDAECAETEADSSLLERALAGVNALNDQYGDASILPFGILHRRRQWNESAGCWMGWERKRGKIDELNCWLLGADDTSFSVLHGNVEALRQCKFVITLDADNHLLPDAAAQLVGALAHPLNRPVLNENGRVRSGYTVIQPRVDLHPATINRTPFARVMSGETGIDLYHSAVSEAYQDLFGQGIYAGKGVYDVQAFARCLKGRVPSNAVLSHDLLEGVLGRAAYASDIVLLESASPNLAAELTRQHRWIRGDWQLLPWLLPIRSSAELRRSVDFLGRWKLVDNLRRSLLAPTLLLMLLAGWIALPRYSAVWTIIVLLIPALGVVFALISDVRRSVHRWGTLRSTLSRLGGNLSRNLTQWLINLAILPIAAHTAADAIFRTIARVVVTRRRLLEWIPSAHAERATRGAGLLASYRRGIAGPIVGATAIVVAVAGEPIGIVPALLGLVWCAAPLLAWYMAREPSREDKIPAADVAELRLLARRTWQFYERFVGPETHWLPPDNYQEAPRLSLAERTSPTNIGLFLLASVAAYDLNYIGASGLLARIDGTTSSISRLRQFRGHLFNWYSTRDLSVLAPDYVSTVDSGNFVAALLVCRTALLDLEDSVLAHVRAADTLLDIIANLDDLVATAAADSPPVLEILQSIRRQLEEPPKDISAWSATVREISETHCAKLDAAILQLVESRESLRDADTIDAVRRWVIQLRYEAGELHAEIANVQTGWNLVNARLPAARAAPGPRTLGGILKWLNAALSTAPSASNDSAEVKEMHRIARELGELLTHRDCVVERIDKIVANTDFSFLFDSTRKLFHIGYNHTTGELDPSYYDLLASEARIASLVSIAKGDILVSHWLHLGRPLRRLAGMRVVLSWSATAFEYLMPRLFMRSPRDGLMDASCRAAIREQRRLASHRKEPWGVSESAYFDTDATGHYKYFAFGADSLALRYSTSQRHVVTPYASLLALPFEPAAVIANIRRMKGLGCWGRYGLYEALDFGGERDRTPRPRIVRTFMAHHQAMILAAIANALEDDSLVRRFHANPAIEAVEHLLHEALPKRTQDRVVRRLPPARPRIVPLMSAEHVRIAADKMPFFVSVIGNRHVTVRSTGFGGGDICWNGQAITRWQPRTQGHGGGDRIYLADSQTNELHVVGIRPASEAPLPEFWSAPHQTELHQRFGAILTRLTTGIAHDNDVVIRRITITNESPKPRAVELTQYSEIVLAGPMEERRHPVFNKLFITGEVLDDRTSALFSRRPRSQNEAGLCCAVGTVLSGGVRASVTIETSRRAFLGRAGSYSAPAALSAADDVSPTTNDGLDPCAAISADLEIPAGSTIQVAFLTAISPERAHALELLKHYQSLERIAFGFDQSQRQAAAELTDLGIDSNDVVRMLGRYSDMLWPISLSPEKSRQATRSDSILSVLWSRGISGDNPIGMAYVGRSSDTEQAKTLLQMQTYLGGRGVQIDVILADESPSSYAEPIRETIESLIEKYRRSYRRGQVVRIAVDSLSSTDRLALDAAAFVCLRPTEASGMQGGETRFTDYRNSPLFVPTRPAAQSADDGAHRPSYPNLAFDNGYGGVDAETGDYVIRARSASPTPAPWINVLANPEFGTTLSERGAATTWYQNSSEHRLTSWYNDPVADRSGEALYLRDEESGEFWSPTPWPVPGCDEYAVTHSAGYSAFEHASHGLQQRMVCFVDKQYPFKSWRLLVRNVTQHQRRLTVTCYIEWVFGNHFEDNSPYIAADVSNRDNTLYARNLLPRSGQERCGFLTCTAPMHGFTTDRQEFLGDLRDPQQPAGLRRIGLTGRVIVRGEPCAVHQIHIDLAAGEETEVYFSLGAGQNRELAGGLAAKCRDPKFLAERFQLTTRYWSEFLNGCQIQTPNESMNQLVNRWLPYQNLACRMWARSGLYQAGGGFGFRDQLQDSLALLHVKPDITRQQILRACAVQFPEGDVLHWWHESPTRGVRTRCSDDLLWLPYVVSEYLHRTGDDSLLDCEVPFLEGDRLAPDENDRFAEFSAGTTLGTVYEHCVLAVEARNVTGAHGLPLFGTGDWNDGMNNVGVLGRGESAWLAWFLADVCGRVAEIARERGDALRSVEFERQREALVDGLEQHAWDGHWYLRGYYDDGSKLGSADNTECKIDLNAQTWPIITGLAPQRRATQAFEAMKERLIDEDRRLIKLLTPPFDRTLKDPGYIKGYPPGVRENGGQYTHAAVWAIWAATTLRKPDLAMRWMDLLNPLCRVTDRAAADAYRGEPYVLAGDVYSGGARDGQAGWTWYTGSAGWLYRIALERVLGFRCVRGELSLEPCVPADWESFQIKYQVGRSQYAIDVHSPDRLAVLGAQYQLDGTRTHRVLLVDDGNDHHVVAQPRSTEAIQELSE